MTNAEWRGQLFLRKGQPPPDVTQWGHGLDISRPVGFCQQSDCLPDTSRANTVRCVPAKPLQPEQKADAARLKAAFKAWQARRRDMNMPNSQETAADELGFGQSALSQYLNGLIPLNPGAVAKFCRLLGVSPADISPSIVAKARADADALLSLDDSLRNVVTLDLDRADKVGRVSTRDQKDREQSTKKEKTK